LKALDIVGLSLLENLSYFIEVDPNYAMDINIIYPIPKESTEEKTQLTPPQKNIKVIGYGPIENTPKTQVFGYEKKIETPKTKETKCFILFNPERRLLKSIGIAFDSHQGQAAELPILAFFKEEDEVIRGCKIELITTHSTNYNTNEIKRTLEVIDIKTVGYYNTGKIIHILAPSRSNKVRDNI